jgi:hypothetical protein
MTWHTLQLFRERLGVLTDAQNTVFPQALFVLQLTLIPGCRRHSQATGDEKIAAIPIRHIDNVTYVSHMLYITHQNDFHRLSPSRTPLLAGRMLVVPTMASRFLGQQRMVALTAKIDPEIK